MAIKFDGQMYEDESQIPDLGSLECVGKIGNTRSYFGNQEDIDKLPTYDNLGVGSDAMLIDPTGANSTIVMNYKKEQKKWEKL